MAQPQKVLSLEEAGALSPQDLIARDMADLATTLERWFEGKGVSSPRIRDLSHPVGAGQSNETILFTLDSANGVQPLVLRIAPMGYQLFMETSFEKQVKLLRTLDHGEHARVPQILWEEEDPAILGQRFFVMKRLPGWVPVSKPPYNAAGRLFDAPVRKRERLWQNAFLELTRLASVPVEDVEFLRRYGKPGLDDLIEYEVQSYRWALAGRSVPLLDEALDWLIANKPAEAEEGLSWGDARIGNMMFDDDFTLLGVFDWEQASLGGALVDLGWWLFFDTLYSKTIGLERLPGLGGRAATIAAWEGLTGRVARDLPWYEYFAGFRLATIFLRKTTLERFSAPTANIGNNMFTRLMAEIRGLGTPKDIIEHFD